MNRNVNLTRSLQFFGTHVVEGAMGVLSILVWETLAEMRWLIAIQSLGYCFPRSDASFPFGVYWAALRCCRDCHCHRLAIRDVVWIVPARYFIPNVFSVVCSSMYSFSGRRLFPHMTIRRSGYTAFAGHALMPHAVSLPYEERGFIDPGARSHFIYIQGVEPWLRSSFSLGHGTT